MASHWPLEGRYDLSLLVDGNEIEGTLEVAGRRVLLTIGDLELVCPLLLKNDTIAFSIGGWIFTGRRDAHTRLSGIVTRAGRPGRWLAARTPDETDDNRHQHSRDERLG